jgi:serine/threonine protein kinase
LAPVNLGDVSSWPGDTGANIHIGPYKLVREIDSGGMGAVHLAVRSDEHYFQIVAIKTIRSGFESPALVQRFRAERQILATLSHPNIGAILDGGDTDDGRPFIAMEYVEGQPITLASSCLGLTIRQRIELFRSACAAVQYAHEHLIIHRDIKPSNVLVTPGGVVKLIDFGIAKPLAPDLIRADLPPTEMDQRLMTPEYASPEQLRGLPLTTATDLYSLGVLLFELLTGSRPYTLRDLSPAEVERRVCDGEPRWPSKVQELSDRARKELSGDLDRIVLMAMDKEPARRYPSVKHLDDDLARFLQGIPVAARRATSLYRLSKFVRRHKVASFMSCTTALVIASSVTFNAWQSRAADRRVSQLESLADSAIIGLTEQLQQSSASTETQALLFRSALAYLEQLRQRSGSDPRVLLSLSAAYRRVGDVEGSPLVANLGRSATAIASYLEGLHVAQEAQARRPSEEGTRAIIETYQRLGGVETYVGRLQEARDHYGRSLSAARDFQGQHPDDPDRKQLLACAYAGLSDVQLNNLETDRAVASLREALRVLGTDQTAGDAHDRALAALYGRMGRALNEIGSHAEAMRNIQNGLTIAEDMARRSPSRQATRLVLSFYDTIVVALAARETMNLGDATRANQYARQAVVLAEGLAANDRSNTQARYDLASAYAAVGDSMASRQPGVAAAWYRRSIAVTREMAPRAEARRWIAERDESLADVLLRKEDVKQRLALLREAHALRVELAETNPPPLDRVHLMRSFCRLSDAELEAADLAGARQHSSAALQYFDDFSVSSPSLPVLRDIGFCYESLGDVRRRMSRDPSLERSEREAAAMESRQWYLKSASVWSEWNNRHAPTPASEFGRHEVERLNEKSEAAASRNR